MYRKKWSRDSALISQMNVVPYIDVMLVLMVIFMTTAPLLTAGVTVDLPRAAARPLPATADVLPIVVSIDKKGQYFLNLSQRPLQPMSADQLFYRVDALLVIARQAHQKRPVYVRSDQSVPYGTVVALMALMQKAGADQVGLVSLTPTSPGRFSQS